MCPKDADGMANIVDPDQTAPRSILICVSTVCPDPSVQLVSIPALQLRIQPVSMKTAVLISWKFPSFIDFQVITSKLLTKVNFHIFSNSPFI